jgi:putative transposase
MERVPNGRYTKEFREGAEYIEIFYNRQRKQARLGFLSPAAFERWFYEKRLAA